MSPSAPTAELERPRLSDASHDVEPDVAAAQAELASAELDLTDATTALLPLVDEPLGTGPYDNDSYDNGSRGADSGSRASGAGHGADGDALLGAPTTANSPLTEDLARAGLRIGAPAAEVDPTTVAIPQATSALPVVLDEPVAATRTIESLMMTSRRAKLALLTLALAAFAFGVNEASVVAMSAPIAAGLGVPVTSVGILATAFALTVVIAAIPLAMATRRWSRRAAVTGAIGTWTVGVVVAASATSLPMLVTGRVVSAAAHALFWAIVAPTAASLFAPHLRARTVTAIMLGASAAGVLGTPLMTWVGASLSWQAPYWALAGFGVVLAVGAVMTLPAVKALGPISGTVGDLPSGKAFARVLAVAFLASVGMSVTWTYIVPFYTDVAGLPSAMLPALFALGGTLAVAATLSVGRFLVRHAVQTVGVGAGLIAVSWVLLALRQDWSAVAAQAVISTGWAIITAGLLTWAMRHTPWRTEMGAGAYTVTMNAGAAIGPLLGAAIVASFGTAWLPVVSLGLTLAAVATIGTVDRRTVELLQVPRRVRLRYKARQQRAAHLASRRKAQAKAQRATRAATRPARPVRSISPTVLRQRRGEWSRRVDAAARQARGSARRHEAQARRARQEAERAQAAQAGQGTPTTAAE
ncbi:MFS transporter [Demequina sp. NBRC 110056]|uniref:MFS transporter n=1 Tax=Demequina sp. NBRC 110056 TaxID=1570345 RepID=UPI0013565427|nr:MFS transporter [Demequina sp. NBRC 110056]